jgi:3-phenylpropionate/trans-cinnamate dioxygenase ferredoxin reductase subunit
MRGNVWWRNSLSKTGGEIINKSLEDKNVMPIFNKEIECFKGSGGKVKSVVTNDGEVHEADFVGVAVGLDYNIEMLQGTDVKCNNGILVDEYMFTGTDGIYSAGDVTEYQDVILGEKNQNGDWGSAKKQGAIAGWNMVNGNKFKKFEWVPSYSITHFEYPIVSFGHPSRGEEYIERKYGEKEWRRLAFKQGRLIGGVLIGNVSSQSAYKKLIVGKKRKIIQEPSLLNKKFNLKDIEERV